MINNRTYFSFSKRLSLLTYYKVIIISFLINFTSFAEVEYEMSIANSNLISENIYEFDVFIKASNENFILTSYQSSFGFNQNIINDGEITFSYLEGTSELLNVPSTGIGINPTDGSFELTFASFPGEESIDSTFAKVGRFRLENSNSFGLLSPNINWNFEGAVSTILTGENFVDITNPTYHKSEFIFLEAVTVTFYMTSIADDIMYYNGSSNDNVSRFGESDDIYRGIEQIYKNLTVPQDAEIISAILEVKANSSRTGTVVSDIYTDLRDNPSSVMSYNDFIGSTYFSSQSYQYSAPSFISGSFYQLDISNIIQSRINELNWTSGDNLGIVIKGNTNLSSDFREITRAENSLTDNKLIITYLGQPNDIEEDYEFNQPTNFELNQNYPNPFNPTTTISFSLPENSKVKLTVFNVLGEVVNEMVNQELNRGFHEFTFSGDNLASGIYVYKLDVENQFTDIKKMILVK